jgi:hypothetical protein
MPRHPGASIEGATTFLDVKGEGQQAMLLGLHESWSTDEGLLCVLFSLRDKVTSGHEVQKHGRCSGRIL